MDSSHALVGLIAIFGTPTVLLMSLVAVFADKRKGFAIVALISSGLMFPLAGKVIFASMEFLGRF